eukprot:827278-Rhodomonas_salina.2
MICALSSSITPAWALWKLWFLVCKNTQSKAEVDGRRTSASKPVQINPKRSWGSECADASALVTLFHINASIETMYWSDAASQHARKKRGGVLPDYPPASLALAQTHRPHLRRSNPGTSILHVTTRHAEGNAWLPAAGGIRDLFGCAAGLCRQASCVAYRRQYRAFRVAAYPSPVPDSCSRVGQDSTMRVEDAGHLYRTSHSHRSKRRISLPTATPPPCRPPPPPPPPSAFCPAGCSLVRYGLAVPSGMSVPDIA